MQPASELHQGVGTCAVSSSNQLVTTWIRVATIARSESCDMRVEGIVEGADTTQNDDFTMELSQSRLLPQTLHTASLVRDAPRGMQEPSSRSTDPSTSLAPQTDHLPLDSREGIVKLSRIGLADPQTSRFTTGLEPIILGTVSRVSVNLTVPLRRYSATDYGPKRPCACAMS